MTTTTPLIDRVRDLQRYIAEGRIVDAMHEFYAEDCVMQENTKPPMRGRDANIAREEEWLDTVGEFKGFEVLALAVEGDVSFVETSMDYVSKDGQEVHLEQVSRARWKDGKIADERFYHE